MSYWSYVNGTITVRTPFYSGDINRIKDYITWSIKQVRHYGNDITGSEGPAEFYVNVGGHPSSYSSETTDNWDYGYITVVGSLRDREGPETIEETKKFLRRLEHFLNIEYINLNVAGDGTVNITENVYSKLREVDADWDKNEEYRDQLFRIQLQNKHRFFDQLLTLEKSCEIAEILTNVSPDTLTGLLCNFGIDRAIDWDYTDSYYDWFKKHKVTAHDPEDIIYEGWFRKRKYPPKVSVDILVGDLRDKVYGTNKYKYPTVERKKLRRLYGLTKAASQNKDVMEEFNRWE